VAFTLRRGQQVRGVKGHYQIERPGLQLVRRAGGRLRPGDTVFVLGYQGEGEYDLWYRGKRPDDTDWRGGAELREVQAPKMTWWLEVRDAHGRRGFVPFRNTADAGFSADTPLANMDSHY
jgi:hypothetical protein